MHSFTSTNVTTHETSISAVQRLTTELISEVDVEVNALPSQRGTKSTIEIRDRGAEEVLLGKLTILRPILCFSTLITETLCVRVVLTIYLIDGNTILRIYLYKELR